MRVNKKNGKIKLQISLQKEKWALPRPEIPSGAALSSVPWHTCHFIQKRDFAGSTAAFERLRRTSNR